MAVKYGVSPGQVFRPAGLAVDDGKLWVVDSVLGVVQIFTEDGGYVDALRDASGNVAHFAAPIGIDVAGEIAQREHEVAGFCRQLLLVAAIERRLDLVGCALQLLCVFGRFRGVQFGVQLSQYLGGCK